VAKSSSTEPRIPTKDDILAFIAREKAAGATPDKIGKREIARAFGLTGSAKIELKRLLKELEADGGVERRGRRVHIAGQLPTVVLADVTGRDRDGELIARPVEWDEDEHGPAPRIAISAPRRDSRRGRNAEPAPGVGDRALLRVERDRDAE
jgi:ribonuclease R